MRPTEGPADAGTGSTLVEAIIAPNPGPLTLDGTRTWLVGTGSVVLIDPGPALPEHLARVQAAVDGRAVDAILLTHAHSDHAGGASAAAAAFGAPVMASSDTLGRTGLAGRVLRDGDTVPVGESEREESDGGESPAGSVSLQVIETPGHAADHISFLLLPDRWLFTGDLVLGEGSSAVLHPDGRMGEYLASIRKLEALRPVRLLPGHGPPVEEAAARLGEYRRHRLDRERQIQLAIEDGSATVAGIREAVYGPLDPGLRAAAEASVSAHLVHLRERGVDTPDPGAGMFETLGRLSERDGQPDGGAS
jgi:hydroxyacylglutathione hydrolase